MGEGTAQSDRASGGPQRGLTTTNSSLSTVNCLEMMNYNPPWLWWCWFHSLGPSSQESLLLEPAIALALLPTPMLVINQEYQSGTRHWGILPQCTTDGTYLRCGPLMVPGDNKASHTQHPNSQYEPHFHSLILKSCIVGWDSCHLPVWVTMEMKQCVGSSPPWWNVLNEHLLTRTNFCKRRVVGGACCVVLSISVKSYLRAVHPNSLGLNLWLNLSHFGRMSWGPKCLRIWLE